MTAIDQKGWPGGPRSRLTIEERIARQEARIAAISERIGHLCSQRVSLEETLADMYSERARLGKVQP